VRHHALVAEAAQQILDDLGDLARGVDRELVLVGAALHDAGKILHPNEMHGPGHRHEPDGRALLNDHGVGEPARFCVTHAQWDAPDVELEDLLVALADKLWKGKRVAELERRVVERLGDRAGQSFWDAFLLADGVFERVAGGADDRLARSLSRPSQ